MQNSTIVEKTAGQKNKSRVMFSSNVQQSGGANGEHLGRELHANIQRYEELLDKANDALEKKVILNTIDQLKR